MSNPLDLGGLGGLMAGMQQQMADMAQQAASTRVEGTAGGGLVTVTANGQSEVLSVKISPDAVGDIELLEDLLVAATNDAMRKAKAVMADQARGMMGGMGLPPGLLDQLG